MLGLAKALAARGARVAIVAYGTAADLPGDVEGVAVIPRPPYRKRRQPLGKLAETLTIWRALWRTPSRFVVRRGAGIDVGLVAAFARLTGRRFVFSTANVVDFDYAKFLPKARDLAIYRYGVRAADSVVVQTEEQVALCERAFSRRPVMIKSIASLCDEQTAFPEAFLWVGRIVSYKRPLEYLALARAVPEARFWMLAVPTPHGEAGETLFDQIASEAASLPNLELLAPRGHAEVGELMDRSVASVNTADFEGMPNVLLEAWSRGVPALVLNHDPSGVVRTYGLGGFANGSPERLAELARELWATRGDRPHLSARCRAYVTDHHGPDAVAAQWLQVFAHASAQAAGVEQQASLEPACAE